MYLGQSPWTFGADERPKTAQEGKIKRKFSEILLGPSEGHDQHSFPTDWLEQRIGDSEDRKAKGKRR